MEEALENLWTLIHSIPEGRVSTYGDVGAALDRPTTGRIVGRWMANCPQGVPWWRVIAKSGHLPIGKRDPYLQLEQTALLEAEGIAVVEGKVPVSQFLFVP